MKKVKLTLISVAILGALSVAFATRPCAPCEYAQQYYKVGNSYLEAGIYGDNYICWNIPTTCTYYRPYPISQPNLYLACRSGLYQGE
jgi:hypothetical protein